MAGIANVSKSFGLGGGAQFWAYISPQNKTPEIIKKWSVTLQHTTSDWCSTITSDDPTMILETPNLSGIFNVSVRASGTTFEEKELSAKGEPLIGCNDNCAGMIGIVATEDGNDANYWTVWDALCGLE